jgi:phosphate transport system substrate-binding protein
MMLRRSEAWNLQYHKFIDPMKIAPSHLFLAALLLLASPGQATAAMIRVGGTGSDLGTMKLLARAFEAVHPQHAVEVLPSLGSSGGIKASLAGAIDIGLTSRMPREAERIPGTRTFAYAKSPLVLATARDNPEQGLTTRQLVEIFAGDRRRWADGNLIRLVLRDKSDSDSRILKSLDPDLATAMENARARRGVPVAFTDQEAADKLQKLVWGLGPTTLSLILGEGRPLKALWLDGVAPTLQNLASGAYPLVKTLYLVTGPEPEPAAESFIAFLRSDAGRAILERTGHLVLDGEDRS